MVRYLPLKSMVLVVAALLKTMIVGCDSGLLEVVGFEALPETRLPRMAMAALSRKTPVTTSCGCYSWLVVAGSV